LSLVAREKANGQDLRVLPTSNEQRATNSENDTAAFFNSSYEQNLVGSIAIEILRDKLGRMNKGPNFIMVFFTCRGFDSAAHVDSVRMDLGNGFLHIIRRQATG